MTTAPTPAPTCALCGAPVPRPFSAPPPELAPDLDLRPGEPTRSTVARWVLTCRKCGLSAADLSRPPAHAAKSVEEEGYRALRGPGPERAALRHAFLLERGDEATAAAEAVMAAAWLRDDAGEDAADLRRRAAALWETAPTMAEGLRQVDALRRAGEFAAAEEAAGRLLARGDGAETDLAVLDYQRGLIAAGDAGRHLLSSALRPPAQRPHVTHGRAPEVKPGVRKEGRGLLSRLFGR